ncbi:hypothetical protein LguiB_023374 [Lonicera macranthoides]
MGSPSPGSIPGLLIYRGREYIYFHILSLSDDDDDDDNHQKTQEQKNKRMEEEEEEELRLQKALLYSLPSMKSSPTLKALEKEEVDYKKKGIVTSYPLNYHTCFQYGASPCTREFGECSHSVCVICADTISSGLMIRINKCNHYVCEDCMAIYVGKKLQENITEIKCPESKCKVALDCKIFEHLIPKEVLDRRQNAAWETCALAVPRFIQCPFRDCSALFRDDLKGYLIRACPKCWKLYCRRCMDSCHLGINCYLSQTLKRRAEAQRRQLMRPQSIVYIDDDDDDDVIKLHKKERSSGPGPTLITIEEDDQKISFYSDEEGVNHNLVSFREKSFKCQSSFSDGEEEFCQTIGFKTERLKYPKKMSNFAYGEEELGILGFKEDVDKLVKRLTRNGDRVPIFGEVGSGKTTLTPIVYRSRDIKQWFHCCAWVKQLNGGCTFNSNSKDQGGDLIPEQLPQLKKGLYLN